MAYAENCKNCKIVLALQIMADLSRPMLNNIGIGSSMICSDIWHKYYEWYFEIAIHKFMYINLRQFWCLCQISRTNYAIICLYYYPQKVCNLSWNTTALSSSVWMNTSRKRSRNHLRAHFTSKLHIHLIHAAFWVLLHAMVIYDWKQQPEKR